MKTVIESLKICIYIHSIPMHIKQRSSYTKSDNHLHASIHMPVRVHLKYVVKKRENSITVILHRYDYIKMRRMRVTLGVIFPQSDFLLMHVVL
jgi:hypothetical protein